MSDLVDENSFISEEAMQLMKFHGSYQQDHREKRAFGQGKFYQFMMRTRQPGGVVSNQLYLAMDDLSNLVRPVVLLFCASDHQGADNPCRWLLPLIGTRHICFFCWPCSLADQRSASGLKLFVQKLHCTASKSAC